MMKRMGPVAVFLLLAGLAPSAGSVVLPADVARQLEQRIDAFVGAPGYQPLDVATMMMPPGAGLDPVTRGMVLFISREAPLEAARYRVTRHQHALDGEWSDIRHSHIEITRYNLAPQRHRMNVATYGEHAAPAGPGLALPHVSWRLATTPLMGQRAAIVAASRRVVNPFEASRAICLERLPCLALGGFEFTPDPFDTIAAPANARAQGEADIAAPARVAGELFAIAAGEHDELHEAATLEHPEMVMVIGVGVAGQERNTSALLHLTSLMDDATAERWIRRLEVPGSVEWQRFDVPRSRRH